MFCAEQYVSTSYSFPTAAILNEISPPTLHSEHQDRKRDRNKKLYKIYSWRPAAQTLIAHIQCLLLPHPDYTRILLRYVCRSATYTAPMQTRFPPFLADIPHLPSHSPLEENTAYTSYSRRRLRVAAASALQNREASGSGDGDQLSCRRLDRSVFMAAAGRDVSLAPSIQLPSNGFSPCFIIIPIISRGGGSRLPPSCPRRPSHSPFLVSDAIWT